MTARGSNARPYKITGTSIRKDTYVYTLYHGRTVLFGTESTLNFEVKRLGAQNIQVTDGRVAFQGGQT